VSVERAGGIESASNVERAIRDQVLRGIALNREPGLHFSGHFTEVLFEPVDDTHARVSVAGGPHCVDHDGQINIGLLLMAADMALASSIRAALDPTTRLATVSLSLQFTGNPIIGPLDAAGEFAAFHGHGESRQGMSRAVITGAAGRVCHGHGAFMALEPPPGVAMRRLPLGRTEAPALAESDLKGEELAVLRHAEKILAEGGANDFLRRFWGFEPRRTRTGASCTMKNGVHVGNRVHHVQGGLLMGLAATTAAAALPPKWGLTGITSCFVSPGVGKQLRAGSKVVHHGLMTGVVRTEITGPDGRRVLETLTTHARI
jgi:acyl-coenzyme A thioesterase PaaI-like protein